MYDVANQIQSATTFNSGGAQTQRYTYGFNARVVVARKVALGPFDPLMGRGLVALLAIPVLFVSGMWAYRLGSPHISESVADDNALTAAQRQYGPQNSVVITAKLYPDADKLVDVHGFSIPVSMSACPSWYPGPAALCPPLSVWAVRVHIPGQRDVYYLVDAVTGDAHPSMTPQVPA